MTLAEYLERTGQTLEEFAEKADTSRQNLHLIAKQGQIPRADLAQRIIEASDYAVSLGDLTGEGSKPAA